MTRDMLYECLERFGVNVGLIKKLNLADDELAVFVDRLAELMKSRCQADASS